MSVSDCESDWGTLLGQLGGDGARRLKTCQMVARWIVSG